MSEGVGMVAKDYFDLNDFANQKVPRGIYRCRTHADKSQRVVVGENPFETTIFDGSLIFHNLHPTLWGNCQMVLAPEQNLRVVFEK